MFLPQPPNHINIVGREIQAVNFQSLKMRADNYPLFDNGKQTVIN